MFMILQRKNNWCDYVSLFLLMVYATLNVLKSLYDHNVTGRSTPVNIALNNFIICCLVTLLYTSITY